MLNLLNSQKLILYSVKVLILILILFSRSSSNNIYYGLKIP